MSSKHRGDYDEEQACDVIPFKVRCGWCGELFIPSHQQETTCPYCESNLIRQYRDEDGSHW